MPLSCAAMLLRVFTDEGARNGGRPLFEDIVLRAREAGLAGATVLRGPMGFGRSAQIHNAGILDLSANLPLVIEIVDTEERLRTFTATLEGLPGVALATLEPVEVVVGEVGATT
jgi:uncharacterized protein